MNPFNLFDAFDITRPIGTPPARRITIEPHVDLAEVGDIVALYLVTNYPEATIERRLEARVAAMKCVSLGAGLDGALDCATNVMRDVRRGMQ